jgi:hypothetical protein
MTRRVEECETATGSTSQNVMDTHSQPQDAGFFVFPDLSVRMEGSYRLKLMLYEVVGHSVQQCASIYTKSFYVFIAKVSWDGREYSVELCAHNSRQCDFFFIYFVKQTVVSRSV